MVIALDKDRCTGCGICTERMAGYCITLENGYPLFDERLCNTCQKCVAICPSRAITVNGHHSEKISGETGVSPEALEAIMKRRRSIKIFQDRPVEKETVASIVAAANWAPNQNKNLSVHVIDDRELIELVNRRSLRFVKRLHRILFGFPPLTSFIRLFYRDLHILKRKMERGGMKRGIFENIQVIIIVTGNRRVPVTESSAHYVLSSMLWMAEAMGIGSCLMDTVYLTFRTDRELRKRLGIKEDVLGAIVLGYSGEKIVNIPRGYEIPVVFNGG